MSIWERNHLNVSTAFVGVLLGMYVPVENLCGFFGASLLWKSNFWYDFTVPGIN